MDTTPWLCLGDFNEILEQKEKQGSYPNRKWWNFVNSCHLIDMRYRGMDFTRVEVGKQIFKRGLIEQRLLWYGVASMVQQWCGLSCPYVPKSISYHVPILVEMWTQVKHKKRGHRPQSFVEKWATKPECEEIIRAVWSV